LAKKRHQVQISRSWARSAKRFPQNTMEKEQEHLSSETGERIQRLAAALGGGGRACLPIRTKKWSGKKDPHKKIWTDEEI